MTRRLLPYEHELIRALKVSEEEYLEFLAAQHDFSRSAEEKLQELRGDPLTVNIVLAVVGVLLSAASALLMPKPKIGGGRQQAREAVFAPRTGFNSAQELAKYGDPVNLVYCNTAQNPNGGVRVATALIWSAIESYGSSQFMQMLLVLGAGRIGALDPTRMAFGQTPIRQFAAQKTWTYFNPIGNVRYSDIILPVNDTNDPTRIGSGTSALVYRTNPQGLQRQEGFSQSFSPSTLTKVGVYCPVPINVNVVDRNDAGKKIEAVIGITIDNSFRSIYWSLSGVRPMIEPGVRFTMTFAQSVVTADQKKDVFQTAAEQRRTLFGVLDAASTYKLGSAKFRVAAPIASSDLDAQSISVTFECIERGSCPEEDYETIDYKQNEEEAINAIIRLEDENVTLQKQIDFNPPIYLPVEVSSANIDPQLNEYLAQIDQRLDILVDYEETQGKIKNFSDIVDSPLYPIDIRNLILAIDANEELIADYQAGGVTRAEKSKISNLSRVITRQEKQLRRLFIDYFDGSYRATRKERLREIEFLRKEMARLAASNVSASGGGRDTAAEQAKIVPLQAQINANQLEIARQQRILANPENWNDYFHTKCLVKVEDASYETITSANVVDFALKAKVFKRVNGRARKYGEVKEPTFKNSDNGTKMRVALFWVWYRRTGNQWTRANRIFAIRRGSDVDNFISLKFLANDTIGNWQFRFEAIAETASEMREYGFVDFAYIENNGAYQTISNPDGTSFSFVGVLKSRDYDLPPLNVNPSQLDEWSLFSTRSDTQLQFSFDGGPEIEIKAVTEQRSESLANYPLLYQNLSLLGFNAYSGQGVQDLRSITAFVTQGKLVRNLNDNGTFSATPDTATSYAPEIFLDTILDGVDGIGRFAKVGGIDLMAMAQAKRFCQRNNLFFDGVVADLTPWRQFWAEVAPFSLLELGRIGGKETLLPAVPTDNAGNIIRTIPISAMFTAGNILDGTYKEEFIDYGSSVQDLIASVIYRDTERDGVFPRNRSVDVSLVEVTEATGIRQSFDLSDYVTNRSQAILFAKLLCNQRRHIRRNIEFRTFPTDSPISPGAYIYVDMGQQDWQGIYSGQVEAGGALNMPLAETVPDGSYNVLLYRSGQAVVSTTISISSNVAAGLAGYEGWLFVLGTTVKAKRAFRVVEVQMDEEGEVAVRAVEHPCDNSGQSLIANFSDSLFSIR